MTGQSPLRPPFIFQLTGVVSKIYTVYAFDFGDVAERAQKYRANATAAFESEMS